nr:hypothetical protein CFP56_07805 [Quercus suber]
MCACRARTCPGPALYRTQTRTLTNPSDPRRHYACDNPLIYRFLWPDRSSAASLVGDLPQHSYHMECCHPAGSSPSAVSVGTAVSNRHRSGLCNAGCWCYNRY